MADLTEYQRVDLQQVAGKTGPAFRTKGAPGTTEESGGSGGGPVDHAGDADRIRHHQRIRWTVVAMCLLMSVVFTVITSFTSAKLGTPITSTMIPMFAFAMLTVCVLLVNPLMRLIGGNRWLLPLTRAELVCIFASLMVTSGIGTFGLVDQLVPVIPGPWNPEWNTPQAGWDEQLLPHLNPDLYITDAKLIRDYREGIAQLPPQGAPMAEHLKVYRQTIAQVPWSVWFKPLAYWSMFVFGCYGMFYCLTYVVLPYWSGREKLVFPLAKLPEALMPEAQDRGWLPPIFRSPMFWLGFSISFLLLNYNGAAAANIIPLDRIRLGLDSGPIRSLVANSVFQGLGGKGPGGLAFLIFFTAIGISFLLPLNISFSIWFYFLVGRFLILGLVWMGYGQSYDDFPDEWIWVQNPASSMGAGGFLLFSAVMLYRCIREYFRLCMNVPPNRRLRVLLPVIGLALSVGIVTVFVNLNHVPIIWSLVFTIFLTLITLGLMRMTAEGGVFWYQAHASFFHFFKMATLGKIAGTTILAPLMPIYGVLFLDVKTFLAPSVANAAKMHEDIGGSRLKFHLSVIGSVVLSVVVGVYTSVCLAYIFGAQAMSNWFYTSYPKLIAEKAAAATAMTPEFKPGLAGWWLFGAVWTALSLYLRQTMFWFPHPIGFVMLINPLMNSMWFSFFIGWVIKKIVVAYGGKQSFDIIRKPMIGLILGELLAVIIWTLMSVIDNQNYNVTLNRYNA